MASGYDISSQIPFRLMKGRLGIYDKNHVDLKENSIDGVFDQQTRLNHLGGASQQERMIRDKRRSLDHAVWYSYQGAEVRKVGSEDTRIARALMNPNKLKQDYDDKIISIGFEQGYEPGTIFEWLGTKTYWLIYLQDLTELAYFRGDIRKCSYEIAWEDEQGNLEKTMVAVRGPVETKINYIQKHGISVDTPNYSLNLLMPKSEGARNYFKRYSKFYLQGDPTCWRVEAIDWFSTPGILEITAVEYYSNETEDDVEAGLVGKLIPEEKDPNEGKTLEILGETFIKIKKKYSFYYDGYKGAKWEVDKDCPVQLIIDPNDAKHIILSWTSSVSGQFELRYGDLAKKTIVVESLF